MTTRRGGAGVPASDEVFALARRSCAGGAPGPIASMGRAETAEGAAAPRASVTARAVLIGWLRRFIAKPPGSPIARCDRIGPNRPASRYRHGWKRLEIGVRRDASHLVRRIERL